VAGKSVSIEQVAQKWAAWDRGIKTDRVKYADPNLSASLDSASFKSVTCQQQSANPSRTQLDYGALTSSWLKAIQHRSADWSCEIHGMRNHRSCRQGKLFAADASTDGPPESDNQLSEKFRPLRQHVAATRRMARASTYDRNGL